MEYPYIVYGIAKVLYGLLLKKLNLNLKMTYLSLIFEF